MTFNGKMFDVPLLETRYRLDRVRFPLSEAPHLDLLHPARRLWKARLESCRLQVLEAELLGVRRRGDIPGEAIPGIYFDYVRRRDARAMARVFEHNRIDIVSLAALAVTACRWVEEGSAEDPRDVLSLARVLERARLYERSEAEYRRDGRERPRCPPRGGPRPPGVARQAGPRSRARRRALAAGRGGGRPPGAPGAGDPPRAPEPRPRRRPSPPWSGPWASSTIRGERGGRVGVDLNRRRERVLAKTRPV